MKIEDLQEKMNRIGEINSRLNESMDQADQIIIAVENFLFQECHWEVPSSILIRREEGQTKYGTVAWLKYARHGREWRFQMVETEEGDRKKDPTYLTKKNWEECSRTDKMLLLLHLPLLLDEIYNTLKRTLDYEELVLAQVSLNLKSMGLKVENGEGQYGRKRSLNKK